MQRRPSSLGARRLPEGLRLRPEGSSLADDSIGAGDDGAAVADAAPPKAPGQSARRWQDGRSNGWASAARGVLAMLPSGLLSAASAVLVSVTTVAYHAFLSHTRIAVEQSIRAGVLRAYVNIENSGIPYDPESNSYMFDSVYLEDVFAKNDVFSELDIDTGGNERLSRDLMSDSAPNAADGCIDELENGPAFLVEIDAWFAPGTGRSGHSWGEFKTMIKHDPRFSRPARGTVQSSPMD